MNEEKIKRLGEVYDGIGKIERFLGTTVAGAFRENIYVDMDIYSTSMSFKIDLRILLACLKIEKEILEEELKGEIKNEK